MMGPTEPLASGVIAYNGDSERGWNDPPTLSFNTVNGSKKGPKLDLRKRVSHQEALTGRKITSPNQNPSNMMYKQGNNLANGLSNLTLNHQLSSQQPNAPPPSISPCHSRHSSGTYTPPLLPDTKSYGMVQSQYPIQSYSNHGSMVPNLPTTPPTTIAPPQIFSPVESRLESNPGIIHPLVQKSSPTPAIPPKPVTTIPRASNLGKPLFSPSGFNMVPISSALDTSHVRANPDISPEIAPVASKDSKIVSQQPLIFTPSLTSADTAVPPLTGTVGKRSPVLNQAYQNSNGTKIYTPPQVTGSGRNSPVVSPALGPTSNASPVSTPVCSHSAPNTPRSLTPDDGYRSEHISRHNSEDFDSQEGMKATVEAIEETIIKCSNILKAREVEDVKRKVGIMKQLWIEGKLSLPVQITMKMLTEALSSGDTETSHKLHVKLMVDYVGEVKQWMVAIKRLISAVGNMNTTVS